MLKYYLFITGLGIFVLALLVASFIEIGSPLSKRAIALDQKRIVDFSSLYFSIRSYYTSNNKLPDSLSQVKISSAYSTTDPENKKPYDYKKISDTIYNLCTTFSTDSEEVAKKNRNVRAFYDDYEDDYESTNSNKKHKKGFNCIKYDLSEDELIYDDYDSEDYYPTPSVKQTGQANNTKRRSDITQILNAISAYATDNKGVLPPSIKLTSTEISKVGVDICASLVPDYIPSLPQDPSIGEESIEDCTTDYETGYNVFKDASDRVGVTAPLADNGESITISR